MSYWDEYYAADRKARECLEASEVAHALAKGILEIAKDPIKILSATRMKGPLADRLMERATDMAKGIDAAGQSTEQAARYLKKKSDEYRNDADRWYSKALAESPGSTLT